MDSFVGEDKTLPLDPDASANITRFQDVSVLGETSRLSDPRPDNLLPPDRFSQMNGRMSPGSRSMKEYSEVISQLKKENFRLKLRIFYMEEKIQKQFEGDQEQLFKTNIELKVECDSLRKELQDKHDLLVKATNAVACFESNPDDAEEARKEAEREYQELKDALQEKNKNQQRDLLLAQEETQNLSKIIEELQEKLNEAREENEILNEKLSNATTAPKEASAKDDAVFSDLDSTDEEDDNDKTPNSAAMFKDEEYNIMKDDIEQKQRMIEQLRESLQNQQTVIEVLTEEKQHVETLQTGNDDLKAKLQDKDNELEKLKKQHERTDAKCRDHISEQQQRLDDFELAVRQMTNELEKREDEVKDLKEALADAEKLGKDLMDQLEAKEEGDDVLKSKEIIMRDKAINGFTAVIRKKDKEIEDLKGQTEQHLMIIEELNRTMANNAKDKPVHQAKDDLIVELRDQLKEQNDTLQHALDEKLHSVNEADAKLREAKNKCRDFERQNKALRNQLEDNEELVKKLDSEIKEKDQEFQVLLNKYKDLQRKHEDQEKEYLQALHEKEDIQKKFGNEKDHFAELTQKLQDQLKNKDNASSTPASKQSSDTIDLLSKKIQNLEFKLANADRKIEELSKQLENSEHGKQQALDELESLLDERNKENFRETESRERLTALKAAEVDRLRKLLSEKDDLIQDLEEKVLLLEGEVDDLKNQLKVSSRKISLWQDDSRRKDAAINELRKALEELSQHSSSPDHLSIIRLTKENVELKQLLKAKESEMEFIKAEYDATMSADTGNPFIESLKREIERKDRMLEDARSRMGADSSTLHSELDKIHKELEDCRMDLQKAQRTIESLQHDLQQKTHWIQKLQDNEKAKDQLIQDLKVANSQGKIPTVDSDEESSLSAAEESRRKHRKKRPQKLESCQTTASQTSVRFTSSSRNSYFAETDSRFTESDVEIDVDEARSGRSIDSLKNEVEKLREELNKIAAENPDENSEDVLQKLLKLEQEREDIQQLGKLLLEEIKLYKNITESEEHREHAATTEEIWNLTQSIDRNLDDVTELRSQLHELLVNVKNHHNTSTQNNETFGDQTLLPHNQTSYMSIAQSSPSNLSQKSSERDELNRLQSSLENTRDQLSDAVREQADLRKTLKETFAMKEHQEEENRRLQEELQNAESARIMSEHQYSTLREEVDRLRMEQNNKRRLSDDNASLLSGDESDGMSTLSRRELRDCINNQRKKLANAEKVNELLRSQLESLSKQHANNRNDTDTVTKLTEEITRLKEELISARHPQSSTEHRPKSPSKSKSAPVLKSKLPIPVDKHNQHSPEDRESLLRKALDQSRATSTELKIQNKRLRDSLLSTEETVRHQSEKLKRCQNALAAAGIASPPLSPIRSARSHPNLAFADFSQHVITPQFQSSLQNSQDKDQLSSRKESDETMDATTQTSNDDSGYLSVSPRSEQKFNSLIQAQSKELSVFRQQLKKSRATCKHLQTELDIVMRYMDTLLSSSGDHIDSMLANGVTTELDRCRKLTKRLREHLAERNADTSLSDTDSDSTWPTPSSPLAVRRQSSQWQKMVKDLEDKEKLIKQLEKKLNNLQIGGQESFEDRYFKKEKMQPPRDILTPSTSQHSTLSDTEDEIPCDLSRPVTVTEYQSLPDNYLRQTWPVDTQATPSNRRSTPMYQRTIAVTEYLPERPRTSSRSGRSGMVTPKDRCTASYGGAWSGSPRSMTTRGLSTTNNDRVDNLTPTNQFNGYNHNYRSPTPMSHYSDSMSSVDHDLDVKRLRHKLHESKRLNRSLKEELNITNLKLRSQEMNTSMSSGYHTARNPAVHNIVQDGSTTDVKSQVFKFPDVLDEHLCEIRALRQKLEASIETNDRLREQLQKKLNEAHRGSVDNVATNIYLPHQNHEELLQENARLQDQLKKAEDEISMLVPKCRDAEDTRNKYTETVRELSNLHRHFQEKQSQTELLAAHINQLTNDLQKEKNLNQSLNTQVKVQDAAILQLQQDLKDRAKRNNLESQSKDQLLRMDSQCSSLQEQLDESQDLVKTLKSELSLYEKLHKNSTSQTDGVSQERLDLTEFLSEIRHLRVQLEQSIETNSALRKQLEEQLKRGGRLGNMESPGRTTTINIHHMSPRDTQDQNTSPKSSAKRRLKLSEDHNGQTVLMTPPPSASSGENEQAQTEFHFDTDLEARLSRSPRKNNHKPFFNFNGPYILGKYSDYAALKQKLTDGKLIVRGVDTKVRNTKSPSRNHEQLSLSHHLRFVKDVEGSIQLLSQLLDESNIIMKNFWPAEIPSNNSPNSKRSSRLSEMSDVSKGTKDAGFGSDSSVNSDADILRKEVGKLRKRLSAQDHLLQSTVDRLQNANKMKEGIEHAILKQLSVTHDVLKKARGNLEAKANASHSTRR